jgi:hypothetical protein
LRFFRLVMMVDFLFICHLRLRKILYILPMQIDLVVDQNEYIVVSWCHVLVLDLAWGS